MNQVQHIALGTTVEYEGRRVMLTDLLPDGSFVGLDEDGNSVHVKADNMKPLKTSPERLLGIAELRTER